MTGCCELLITSAPWESEVTRLALEAATGIGWTYTGTGWRNTTGRPTAAQLTAALQAVAELGVSIEYKWHEQDPARLVAMDAIRVAEAVHVAEAAAAIAVAPDQATIDAIVTAFTGAP